MDTVKINVKLNPNLSFANKVYLNNTSNTSVINDMVNIVIDNISYNHKSHLLAIRLKNGEHQLYYGVPALEYLKLVNSYSKETYFQHNIAYKYRNSLL